MERFQLSRPQLAFVVGTRAALALGLGLLASARIPDTRRRAAGRMLVAIGALTTIPAFIALRRNRWRN